MSSALLGVAAMGHRNVLFIAIDDLRPNIAAYGASFMHTPHLDALAASATLFQRAYAQYSFCGPSRNSFLTGRRPDATRAFSFMNHFREPDVGPDWVSLPEHFRKHGYLTLAAGKLFHPGLPPNFDAAQIDDSGVPQVKSWTRFVFPQPAGTGQRASDPCLNATTNGWPLLQPQVTNAICTPTAGDCAAEAVVAGEIAGEIYLWCAVDTTKLSLPLQDDAIANATVHHLREAATQQPFFVGSGLHKPHLPFMFPKEFADLYPPAAQIAPPKQRESPAGMPLAAWHPGGFHSSWDNPTPAANASVYRRAYYSSVSYTDHNIGLILAELDALRLAPTTMVVAIGDHGWQLGEMNLWRKMTNFELGTRVPLMMRVPWKAQAPRKSPQIVEAVSLYRTLSELAALPTPEASVDGESFASVFDGAPAAAAVEAGGATTERTSGYAFSQFAKANKSDGAFPFPVPWDECTKCNHTDIDVMGLAVRDDRWRYVEWHAWNKTALRPEWGAPLLGIELYDHDGDLGEDLDAAAAATNVAVGGGAKRHAATVRALSAVLEAQFRS